MYGRTQLFLSVNIISRLPPRNIKQPRLTPRPTTSIMAPRSTNNWDRSDESQSNINTIQAQLLITEAGVATAEAYQIKTALELSNLNREMATLRRMLKLQPASSPAVSSSPAAAPPSLAAISIVSSSPKEPLTILCRGCQAPLSVHCGFDTHLRENIKNGTMKPRLSCFDCKKMHKFARCGRKGAATASTANDTSAAATTLYKKVAKNKMKGSTVAPPSTTSSAASTTPSAAVVQPSLASPLSSPTVSSIRYVPDGPGVAIRDAPFYPGKRTLEQIYAGRIVAVSEFKRITHIDADRKPHTITFYRLADGRGWVHDFCPTSSTVAFSRVLTTPPSSPATVASVTAEPTVPSSRPPSPTMTSRFDSPWPPGTPLAEQAIFSPDDYRRFISYARFPLHLLQTQTHADSTSPLQSR